MSTFKLTTCLMLAFGLSSTAVAQLPSLPHRPLPVLPGGYFGVHTDPGIASNITSTVFPPPVQPGMEAMGGNENTGPSSATHVVMAGASWDVVFTAPEEVEFKVKGLVQIQGAVAVEIEGDQNSGQAVSHAHGEVSAGSDFASVTKTIGVNVTGTNYSGGSLPNPLQDPPGWLLFNTLGVEHKDSFSGSDFPNYRRVSSTESNSAYGLLYLAGSSALELTAGNPSSGRAVFYARGAVTIEARLLP